MREILFRGKRIDNGEWVYGYLAEPGIINVEVKDDSTGFLTYDDYEVNPETVGQFTGKKDVNGKDIYSGDIVGLGHSGYKSQYEVVWSDENAGWHMIHAKRECDKYGLYTRNFGLREDKKIVGNIHELPTPLL